MEPGCNNSCNSNTNKKTKSLFYRLSRLNIRKKSNNSNNNNVSLQRSASCNDGLVQTNSQNTNNFRRSLRKMHIRIRNCVTRHRNNNRTVSNATSTSRQRTIQSASNLSRLSHSRFTLNSTQRTQVENIYSMDPTQSQCSISSNEDISLVLPARLNIAGMGESSRSPLPSPSSTEQPPETPRNLVFSLLQCTWYWGPVSRSEVERRLANEPDGAFLIRDSTSDKYIFTISFRSVGKTLHTRIEHDRSGYFLFDQNGYESVKDLVDNAIEVSKNDIFCFTKNADICTPNFPVRLLKPLSRYNEVKSLKHLTRFVIRQFVTINNIEKLPLPETIIAYVQEANIF